MDHYSQQHLKVAATEAEHLVRKADLDGKVAIGVEIERFSNGLSTVRLLDANGRPTGRIIRDVVVLPNRNATPVTTPGADPHETWDALSADEMIERAAKHNPLTEVEIL